MKPVVSYVCTISRVFASTSNYQNGLELLLNLRILIAHSIHWMNQDDVEIVHCIVNLR